MENLDPAALRARRNNRLMLLGVLLVFIGPLIVAGVLGASGWRPSGSKAYGKLVDPPQDIGSTRIALASGEAYLWRNPQWQWTLLALPGSRCADKCRAALDDVLRMRATLGRNAPRLRVLYLGEPLPAELEKSLAPLQQGSQSSDAFAPWRAQGDDSLSLALVDPGGLLMMQYPSGFDVSGVRGDLPKVIN